MLYVRGNRRNYDEWAEMGAKGWSYEEVLPYFKKLEDNMNPEYVASGKYFYCENFILRLTGCSGK